MSYGSAHRDSNINLRLNQKIPIVFDNLKNYDCHFIMQELSKFNVNVNIIQNGLEKYMNFWTYELLWNTINNKISFIDSFQFLSSSLDSLVRNFNKDDFKYLSQKFDVNVLDLVKKKGFYPFEYMTTFEKFEEKLPSKEKFYISLTGKKLMTINMIIFLRFGTNLKWKW